MPLLRDQPQFDVSALTTDQLHQKRAEIVSSAEGNPERMTTEQLHELCAITAALTRRSSGPPKSPRGKKPAKGGPLGLDDIL